MMPAGAAGLRRMRPADLAMALLVIVIWGSNFTAMRVGALDLPPFFLLGLRLAVAAAVLVWFLEPPGRHLPAVLAISIVMTTLHFGLGLVGFRAIEASTGAIVMQSAVPFASLLAWLSFGETLGWRRFAGMAIAFAGIVVIAGASQMQQNLPMIGVLVFSAFCFALANILIRRLGEVNIVSLNGWITLLGAPQAFLLSLILESGQTEALQTADWPAYAALLYMAIAASVLAHTIWYRLVPRFETNQTMPLTLLVPVVGVVCGMVLLGERLTLATAIGGLVTIAGVAIIVCRPVTEAHNPAMGDRP